MLGLAALLTALLTAIGPAAAQEQKEPDCPLRMIASLQMHTMPDGRVTVPVQLDGHEYRLMVDTGGYINTVSPMVTKERSYQPVFSQGTTLRGMGTTLLNRYVQVQDFAIGRTHGKDFRFFVDDINDVSVDGTLAPQILAAYDLDLDFAHEKMNLVWPDHCPGKVVYWTRGPVSIVPMEMEHRTHIRIPITIDGKEMMATLDTGANTSYISEKAAARFLGIDEKSEGIKLRGNIRINGMLGPVRNYPFRELKFGDITVNNPRIDIVSDAVYRSNDLLLGIGILRQLHMYIAYKERKMYITPALAN
jgi:predicted aspartyl protease